MIRVNLLPVREARRRADLQQQAFAFVLVVGLAGLVVGWMHYSVRSDIAEAKQQVASIQEQIKKFDAQLKQVEAYKLKKQEVQQKLDVIHALERSRSGPVHVMDELASHTPERMWITRLETEGPRITIQGMSLDNEIVAILMTEMNKSPYFGDVELTKTELQDNRGLKLNRFEVTGRMDDPNAPKREEPAAATPAAGAKGGKPAARRPAGGARAAKAQE